MKKNHQTTVSAHLKTGKMLSRVRAIYHFDCYCLSTIIQHLRIAVHNIVNHNESNLNSKGANARNELNEVWA